MATTTRSAVLTLVLALAVGTGGITACSEPDRTPTAADGTSPAAASDQPASSDQPTLGVHVVATGFGVPWGLVPLVDRV